MKLLKKLTDSLYGFFKKEPTKEIYRVELDSILKKIFGDSVVLGYSDSVPQWFNYEDSHNFLQGYSDSVPQWFNYDDSYNFLQNLNHCWSNILTTYNYRDIEISYILKHKIYDIHTEMYIYEIDIAVGGILNQNCNIQFITKSNNKYHINCLTGNSSHDTIDSLCDRIKMNMTISKMAFILLPFMPSINRNFLGIYNLINDYSVIQNNKISEYRLVDLFSEICPNPNISNGVISALKEYNAFEFIN